MPPQTFNIYPNPNNGEFVFAYEIEQNAQLIIYNITGQKMVSFDLQPESNTLRIVENELENGIYFYKVFSKDEIIHTGKFTIIK